MLRKGTYVLMVALLVTAVGCFPTDTRTSDQGGGNLLLTVGPKLLQQNVGDLNPDEWQILADAAPTLASQFGINLDQMGLGELDGMPAMTNDQAQAIVNFLDDQSVKTFSDLETLVQNIDAGTVTVPQELIDMGLAAFTQA